MLRSFSRKLCGFSGRRIFFTYVGVILLKRLSVIEVPKGFVSGPFFEISQKVNPPSKVTIVVTLVLSLLIA